MLGSSETEKSGDGAGGRFVDRICDGPVVAWDDRVRASLAEFTDDGVCEQAPEERSGSDEAGCGIVTRDSLAHLLDVPKVRDLIAGVICGSPYLAGLMRVDHERLRCCLDCVPEEHFAHLNETLAREMDVAGDQPAAMKALRAYKSGVALLTALCDIAGVWPVMTATDVLARSADLALTHAVRFLFRQASAKGQWHAADAACPEVGSGYIVLGLGKHGANELNYSSDIDLIVFYDRARARLKEGLEPQPFFVRLTRDLVRLMQDRTEHGYVFRTDLRLRPDAGATQIALSTDAAIAYYESFGQNWERAAMIKARAVAGDIEAGEALLAELQPFIWRKYLDFAAIADVHAMKRQIHAFRQLGGIGVAGHNIKLGRGGIREIEFFVQTQQLIAGGRQVELRQRQTLVTLDTLAERGWIEGEVRDQLRRAYLFLRRIEHRIQMVADEQTHDLPSDAESLERFAKFAGYENTAAFSAELLPVLETVQSDYAALFEDSPGLSPEGANMVFAGQDDDPGTIAMLSQMGFSQPASVIATVRGWHSGRYAAVRSARSRERLTEVQPLLLEALSQTADPDGALSSFDRFMSDLPTGVQLFSLLRANPNLMRLVADIMGTAPRLAQVLSRRRRLLDAVIDPRTFSALPDSGELEELIASELARGGDLQEVLDRARIVGSEQSFLIGVRVLSGVINASQAGGAYAVLAERLVSLLQEEVERELSRVHGRVAGGAAAVVAMGKLGGREMTATSDLDLIVVYDFDEGTVQSDGARALAPQQYYARMTQRLISALSAPTAEGLLYEVDMRLRPSGQQGPVATRLGSFIRYQAEDAWTWEHLALTRARVISGPPEMRSRIDEAIRAALCRPRDREKIAADVHEMRQRIAEAKGGGGLWDLKTVPGGMVDLEFIAQFLQLVYAEKHPEVLDQNTLSAFRKLRDAGLITQVQAEVLMPATRLVHNVTQILRICVPGRFDPGTTSAGLKQLAARAGEVSSFVELEDKLQANLAGVADLFPELVA